MKHKKIDGLAMSYDLMVIFFLIVTIPHNALILMRFEYLYPFDWSFLGWPSAIAIDVAIALGGRVSTEVEDKGERRWATMLFIGFIAVSYALNVAHYIDLKAEGYAWGFAAIFPGGIFLFSKMKGRRMAYLKTLTALPEAVQTEKEPKVSWASKAIAWIKNSPAPSGSPAPVQVKETVQAEEQVPAYLPPIYDPLVDLPEYSSGNSGAADGGHIIPFKGSGNPSKGTPPNYDRPGFTSKGTGATLQREPLQTMTVRDLLQRDIEEEAEEEPGATRPGPLNPGETALEAAQRLLRGGYESLSKGDKGILRDLYLFSEGLTPDALKGLQVPSKTIEGWTAKKKQLVRTGS